MPLPDHHTYTSSGGAGRPRIEFIQALQGLAVLLVLWGHLGPAWLGAHNRVWLPHQWWKRGIAEPLHLFQDGAHAGVLVFFLISGYIITFASLREDRYQFTVKRVLRIMPVLLMALVLSLAMNDLALRLGFGGLWGIAPWSARSFLESLALVNWIGGDHRLLGPTWTLEIEVLFYALTCIFLPFTRRNPFRATVYMALTWCAFCLLPFVFFPGQSGSLHHPVYIAFLLLGRVVYLAHHNIIALVDALLLAACLALTEVLLHSSGFPGELLGGGAASLASQVGAILLFLMALRATPQRWWSPFAQVGDWSYSLYLLHIPIGMFVLEACTHVGLPFTASLLTAICFSLLASWAGFTWVERPLQRVARKLLSSYTSKDPTLTLPSQASSSPCDTAPLAATPVIGK